MSGSFKITKSKKKRISYALHGYLFAVPFIVGLLVFTVYPLISTFYYSFVDLEGLDAAQGHFVGLNNYIRIFHTPQFWDAFKNTIIEWGVSGLIQVPLALLVVAWLTNKDLHIRYQGLLKGIAYVPNIINAAAIAMFFASVFDYPGGILNQLLKSLGILEKSYEWSSSITFMRLLISYTDLWRYWGVGMLLFLAAAKGISLELYDAASIDGANDIQKFFHITLPGIRTVLTFQIVSIFAGGLQLYEAPMLIGGGVYTRTVAIYIRNLAFTGDMRTSLASAASFVLFLIILAIDLVVLGLLKEREPRPRKGMESV